jgi:hypothetical protein
LIMGRRCVKRWNFSHENFCVRGICRGVS